MKAIVMLNEVKHLDAESARCFASLNMTMNMQGNFVDEVLVRCKRSNLVFPEAKKVTVMLNEVKHLNAESARCFASLNMTMKMQGNFVDEVVITL